MPENYIQLTNGDMVDANEMNVDGDIPTSAPVVVAAPNGGGGDAGSAGYNSGRHSVS